MKKLLLANFLVFASGYASAQCVAPANPTPVTATPSQVCSDTGVTAILNAISTGNNILWYTTPTGGTAFATTASAGNVTVTPSTTTTYYAEAVATGGTQSTTFSYTGTVQYFVVPVGVTSVSIEAWGAQGNSNALSVVGGMGGYATGNLLVNPGDTLWIKVGGGGTVSTLGGYNGGGNAGAVGNPTSFGGGGGGATDVRYGGVTLANRVIVAGGGGGAGGNRVSTLGRGTGGGGGGGYYGGGGGAAWPSTSLVVPTGGTQVAGGSGGTSTYTSAPNNNGYPGVFGIGGNGGDEVTSNQAGSQAASIGGVGGGSAGTNGTYAGNFTGQSGAGGSGYVGTLLASSMSNGIRSGNGQVVISYIGSCASSGRTPVTVTINPIPVVNALASVTSVCDGDNITLSGSGATSYVWTGPVSVTDAVPFTASMSAGGTYTVTGTDANGCSNTDTISLNINPLPVLDITAVSSSICVGDSTVLTASGADSYYWLQSGGTSAQETVAPTATTSYIVTGTTTLGCSSNDTFTVVVNPLPVLSINASSAAICLGGSDTLTASGANFYSWSSGGNAATEIVSPTQASTYIVTGIDINGCVAMDSITVGINSNPDVVASANPAVICAGASSTISAVGANSYVWSTGATTSSDVVTPTNSTSYSVVGTDANGCTDSDTVLVTVNQLPVVTLTLADNAACTTDGPLALAGGSPVGGTWSGVSVTGSTFSPQTSGAGTFPILYTYVDTNGCTSSATQNVVVSICAGINETGDLREVKLFPNPTNDQLNLTWALSLQVKRLDVVDATGRVVMSQAVSSGTSATLQVAQLPVGIYQVVMTTETGSAVYRFAKNQ